MKKYIIYIALLLCCNAHIKAQCFGNEGCSNGTSTDVSQPCPSNNDFHKNTFDWTQPTIPINKANFTNYSPVGSFPLGNPFFSSQQDYISHIALGTGSDFQPSDGWELVKQDFGYFYGSGIWNGTTISSQANNPPFVADQSLPYFMLYNKYTGVLRLFADPFSNGQQYDNIEVTISFLSGDLSDPASSNYANYAPSALFSAYDTIMHPLVDYKRILFQKSKIMHYVL